MSSSSNEHMAVDEGQTKPYERIVTNVILNKKSKKP